MQRSKINGVFNKHRATHQVATTNWVPMHFDDELAAWKVYGSMHATIICVSGVIQHLPHGLEVTSTSSCSLSLTSVRRILLTLTASSSLHCQLSEPFCIIIKDSDFSSLCHSMDTSFSLGQDTTYDCNSNVPHSLLLPVHVLWIIPTPAWVRKSEHMAWRDRWSQLHYSSRYHYVQCSFQLVIQNSSPHEYSP